MGFYGPVTEITAVELQHAGTRACQFCSVGDAGFDGSVTFFANSVPVDASAGTAYSAEAWVRAAPGRPTPSKLALRIDIYPSSGPPTVGTSTNAPALGDAYQRTSALRILDAPAQGKIQLTLRSENLDTCFIVDDAALYLTK